MLFNGVDFSDYVVVEHIRRKILPNTRKESRPNTGSYGERLVSNLLGTDSIEVDLRLIHDNRIDMQERAREVASLLHTEKDSILILRDDPTRFNWATVEGGANLETYLGIGLTTVTFVCMDPLSYSRELTMVNLPNTIYYDGTYKTRGMIDLEVTEDCSWVEVRNVTSGEFVKIEYEFQEGDSIVLDMVNEYVSINDYDAMRYLTWDSDFFDIQIGMNVINLTSAVGEITYRKRWK